MLKFLMVPILSTLLLQNPGCKPQSDEEMKTFGPKERTDLVFFFKNETDQKQIEHFLLRDGLVIPAENGTGHYLPDGMGTGFGLQKGDFEGYGLNFKKSATSEQRLAIKKRIEESPLVYKIYENVVPNEIYELPRAEKEEPTKTPDTRPTKKKKDL